MIDFDKFCKRCKHYAFDLSQGILCGLTNKKPDFEDTCKDFSLDFEKEEKMSQESKLKSTKVYDKEGMTTGEWIGAILCTPYGLIKYFDWKKQYPRKAKQVCTFYLIAIPISILLRILIEASQ